MELKLYTATGSRGLVCEWLLEELALAYERVDVDLSAGEHKSAAYRRVHPLGALPALVIDGQPMMETLAICLFLAGLDADGKLAPVPEHGPAYGRWLQWMVYPVATLEPALVPAFMRGLSMAESERRGAATSEERDRFATLLAPLNVQMERGHLSEQGFGAADVGLCCRLLWADQVGLLPDADGPAQVYLARHLERPATLRVFERTAQD